MKTNKVLVSFIFISVVVISLSHMLIGASETNPQILSGNGETVLLSGGYSVSSISLTPGSDASKLNFTWYSSQNVASIVQIAKKSDMQGENFPVETAQTFTGAATVAEADYPSNSTSSNKVTAYNLQENTEYVYRLGDGTNWSDIYYYKTYSTDEYSFIFVADPQIGASGVPSNSEQWINTITTALDYFPDTSFMVSAGDQVETATSEYHYFGYLAPPQMKNISIATVPGNHDNSGNYINHFNNPNHSPDLGTTAAGGNYYYTYGNTLFMMLNSNSTSTAEHKSFMQNAIAQNPDATWRIVVMHHSIYSSGPHSVTSAIQNRRSTLFPVMDELGIDVVLAGHDHAYTRTYQMIGNEPQKNQFISSNGDVLNPTGTLYITGNSASGSKYYSLNTSVQELYSAVRSQVRVPTFSNVTVTENSFEITTYRTDTMDVLDTYKICKGVSAEEIFSQTKDYLGFNVLSTENINRVTNDLTLPSNYLNVQIEWHSSHPDVIGTDGKVNRPSFEETDQLVTLTAIMSIDNSTDTKDFKINVKKEMGNDVSVSVNNLTGEITVEGDYGFGGEDQVSILVTNSEDEIVYIYHDSRSYDGFFEFKFFVKDDYANNELIVKVSSMNRENDEPFETQFYLYILETEITIEKISFFNTEGQTVDALTPSQELVVEAEISNNTEEAMDISLVAALYTSDGTLVKCVVTTETLAGESVGNPVELIIDLPNDVGDGHYLKVFTWNSTDTMRPLETKTMFP